jgi:hypothetical protein
MLGDKVSRSVSPSVGKLNRSAGFALNCANVGVAIDSAAIADKSSATLTTLRRHGAALLATAVLLDSFDFTMI